MRRLSFVPIALLLTLRSVAAAPPDPPNLPAFLKNHKAESAKCMSGLRLKCVDLAKALDSGALKFVAPSLTIASRDAAEFHSLFPNCVIAPGNFATGMWDQRAENDPLFWTETHIGTLLPFGPFRVYSIEGHGGAVLNLISAGGYKMQTSEVTFPNLQIFYLQRSNSPCRPIARGVVGDFELDSLGKSAGDVISINGELYVAALSLEARDVPRLQIINAPTAGKSARGTSFYWQE